MPSYYLLLPIFATITSTIAFPKHGHYSSAQYAPSPATTVAVSSTTTLAGGTTMAPTGTATSGTGSSICDATSTLSASGYTIMANIWGATPGIGGQQCAQVGSGSGSGVSWSSTWSWSSGTNIKSFANAAGGSTPCKPVNQITSLPSTWQWRYAANSPSRKHSIAFH